MPRCCPHCQQSFEPSQCHPNQLVCSRPECQRRRHANYRRAKLASDPAYAEKCRQSARQWRKEHSEYWDQYREAHPAAVERNREQQQARNRKLHLANLANNTLAWELKPCPATVWLLGRELHALANNTLAPAQLWILQALPRHGSLATPVANNTALAC